MALWMKEIKLRSIIHTYIKLTNKRFSGCSLCKFGKFSDLVNLPSFTGQDDANDGD